MSPLRSLAVYAAFAIALILVGYKWRDYQADADELALSRLKLAQYEQLDRQKQAVAARLESFLEVQRLSRPKTVIVEKEIAKSIYVTCGVPPDGVRLYNESVAARSLPAAR